MKQHKLKNRKEIIQFLKGFENGENKICEIVPEKIEVIFTDKEMTIEQIRELEKAGGIYVDFRKAQ